MSTIEKFISLNNQNRLRVAVVGDSLIDEYYHVKAERISPEFPIPVMLSPDADPDFVFPGGAGNVYRQFTNFNVDGRYFSIVNDYAASIYRGFQIPLSNCEIVDGVVPIKKRIYHNDFPLCRWDIEQENYGLNEQHTTFARLGVFDRYDNDDRPDVTIFSDYDKGVFGRSGGWVGSHNTISIVDPKKGPLTRWIGCTVFKPNAKEAIELSNGITDWKEQSEYFRKFLACRTVVITRGADSICGWHNGEFFEFKPQRKITAESVIGAGDCFVAMFALAYGHGMKIEECVEVAWTASSVYVQRKYNTPVSPDSLRVIEDPAGSKIVTPEFLSGRHFPLTLTNGCFDILHTGHVSLLQFCKDIGNPVVVAVNSDNSVRRLKGEARPINHLAHRTRMLASLSSVDFVVPFEEDTPYELIKKIHPDVIVKGGDYTRDSTCGSDLVEDVRIFPFLNGLSTTNLISAIKNSQ